MPGGGAIRLAVRHDDAPAGFELEVTDDGPGIAPELLPHVFDRFTKSAGSRGSGLGLAIARAIVTAHGGTIDAAAGSGRARHHDPHLAPGHLSERPRYGRRRALRQSRPRRSGFRASCVP